MKPQVVTPSKDNPGKSERVPDWAVGAAVAGTAILIGCFVWWSYRSKVRADSRRRMTQRLAQDDLERGRWEEHNLDNEEVFKRRYHRWDPWLRKIGYFDRKK